MIKSSKRQFGQYFTRSNPFELHSFYRWFSLLNNNAKFLEPFAGSNHIIEMIDSVYGAKNWSSHDIDPPQVNVAPYIKTEQRDTLLNMPTNYDAIITNPPYLSRNSATRRGLAYPKDCPYDDIYKYCLEKMLGECGYVAAIIPESFITANIFMERLYAFISLTTDMFDDTDCPVCIAMFVPESTADFTLYRMDEHLGTYNGLTKIRDNIFKVNKEVKFTFNDPNGQIGIRCVDGTKFANIRFVKGTEIDSKGIKVSSRALTRVSFDGFLSESDLKLLLLKANKILDVYREQTHDIFMTSFKGLREDGKYRRRLDFKTASKILNVAMQEL